ncbi:MAG: aminotransferase class IV [Enterobacterales bacterium]|nr:aminotransferase class IV [Enterobacterales bacterium]
MSVVFLNDRYLPLNEAKISPLDRGFLFGDGIYELIPCYQQKMIGLDPHIERLQQGLSATKIAFNWSKQQWRELVSQLVERNNIPNVGIYIQISRGADTNRSHGYPKNITPTLFAMAQPIADFNPNTNNTRLKIKSELDRRWRRCDIKSTSLLGNLMHFDSAQTDGYDEILVHSDKNIVHEGSSSNIFVVKDNQVSTPIANQTILPGITRRLLIKQLIKSTEIQFEERNILLSEAIEADEIWITSSSRQIQPVVNLNGQPVGTGEVGDVYKNIAEEYYKTYF